MTANKTSASADKKQKKPFKMPHLLWIMLGLIVICSILTYIIPAGAFAIDESGAIIGNQFMFLGKQTPVNPINAIMDILPGLAGSASIIFAVMMAGASIEIFLSTKAFDKMLNWAIFKLQGKGENIIISIMFCIMVYLGAFGGSDALIAIVPIGIVFAKKLKLDNIVAIGVSTFATLIGFGTGPTKTYIVQGLMGTKIYGAFFSRFIIMNIFMAAGLLMVLSYVKKIRKDPTKSLMYEEGWRPDAVAEDEKDTEIKEEKLEWRTVINMILFFGQFVYIVLAGLFGDASLTMQRMVSVMLIVGIIQGIIAGMNADEIAAAFTKGLASLAFVGIVIGLARTVSIILSAGNILHTIVYAISLPLLSLPSWLSSVGMMLVIAIINPIIPSATSKAAILVPILKPLGEVLGLAPEMIVQAFQFGDGFTNIISPLLGWTVGSLAMTKIPFNKWFKWAFPKVMIFLLMACIMIFAMSMMGWTGAW
ncbi:MAG: YfcC family protein [Erysipelotrichia bacterium]|nr:YfcC family protein [Erysipelotrichia bacterium]